MLRLELLDACLLLLNRAGNGLVTALRALEGGVVLAAGLALAVEKVGEAAVVHACAFEEGVAVAKELVLLGQLVLRVGQFLSGGIKVALELGDVLETVSEYRIIKK